MSICLAIYLRKPSLFLSDEVLLDFRLGASFNASNPVSHWVEAGHVRVGLSDSLEFLFAQVESLLPVNAFWLAGLHNEWLRVLSLLQHVLDGVYITLETYQPISRYVGSFSLFNYGLGIDQIQCLRLLRN